MWSAPLPRCVGTYSTAFTSFLLSLIFKEGNTAEGIGIARNFQV